MRSSVTDTQRAHETPAVLPYVQEGRALGGAQPLVAVAGAVRHIELSKIKGDDARAVGRVEKDVDPSGL